MPEEVCLKYTDRQIDRQPWFNVSLYLNLTYLYCKHMVDQQTVTKTMTFLDRLPMLCLPPWVHLCCQDLLFKSTIGLGSLFKVQFLQCTSVDTHKTTFSANLDVALRVTFRSYCINHTISTAP